MLNDFLPQAEASRFIRLADYISLISQSNQTSIKGDEGAITNNFASSSKKSDPSDISRAHR